MMAPEAFAEHWAAAWSNRDTGAYFDLYGQDFRSPSGRTKSQWQGARKYIMEHAERIDVTLEHVKVTPRGERTLVDFWQTYESDRFRSRVPKRLVLAGGPGQWRIVGEGVRTRSSGEASA